MKKYSISYYPQKFSGENKADKHFFQFMARQAHENFKLFTTNHFQELKPIIESYIWSPIIFDGGKRKQENFMYAQIMALDFDGTLQIRDAMQMFDGYTTMIGLTKSHTTEKNKFRVLIPFSEPLDRLYEYRRVMGYLTKKYRSDRSCIDGARFYFPCKKVVQYRTCRETMKICFPKTSRPTNKKHSFNYDGKVLPKHIRLFVERGITFGVGRNQSAFVSGFHLARCGLGKSDSVSMIEKGAGIYICDDDFPKRELLTATTNGWKAGA